MIKNVVIFAAGKGTRMSPLTDHIPKPLVKVNNKSIIERNIEYLHELGIKDITIVVGYLKDQFEFIKNKYGVELIANEHFDSSNNISSLVASKEIWGDTLYIEGDIFLKRNILSDVEKIIKSKNGESVMFGAHVDYDLNEWFFETEDSKVVSHRLGNAKGKYIWAGIFYVNKKMGDEINKKVDAWFALEENRQKYAEQFLWTLDNKFVLESISSDDFHELDSFSDLIKIDKSYATQNEYVLFTPGPTNVPRELWDVISSGIVHHRSKLAEYYINELTNGLKNIFQTVKGLPLLITASGTGAMETSVVNFVNRGDKVIVINTGDFGERYNQLLETYGADIIQLKYDRGTTYNLKDVEKNIEGVKAIYITHHETSTGVLNDIKSLGKLAHKHNVLFIVDSISSIVTEEFKFDEWHVDVALASTPKAFALTPGLSFVCVSEKAIKVLNEVTQPRYYFDLRKYIEYFRTYKQTPFTPAISLIIGMVASINIINNKSLEFERNNKQHIYDYIESELFDLGFVNEISKELRTRAMLVLRVPSDISAVELRNKISFEDRIHFEVGRGEEATTKLRIGILGPVTIEDAARLVESIKKNL